MKKNISNIIKVFGIIVIGYFFLYEGRPLSALFYGGILLLISFLFTKFFIK